MTQVDNKVICPKCNHEMVANHESATSQFWMNSYYELRTPLNAIIGFSRVLLEGIDGELTKEAKEDVEAIHNNGKQLLSFIDNILDIVPIRNSPMRLEIHDVDLVECTAEIIRHAQILVKDKPVDVVLEHDENIPMISADYVRLRQILLSLVSNAVKFTEKGSVTVRLSPTHDNKITICVIDSGIGIPEEELDMIFEPFHKVSPLGSGTGLGLTITRQLIQMHGGDIKVESELGIGSTFTFTLPIKVAEGETEKA